MEFVVYILYSYRADKIYIGFTRDLISRFQSHNELSTKGYTVRFRPWQVIYCEFFSDKKAAMLFEQQLKSGKGREWIWSNIKSNLHEKAYLTNTNPIISKSQVGFISA